jgi:hypothetical protein
VWRMAIFAIILCSGCAAERSESLLQDSVLGDVYDFFVGPKSTTPPFTPYSAPEVPSPYSKQN